MERWGGGVEGWCGGGVVERRGGGAVDHRSSDPQGGAWECGIEGSRAQAEAMDGAGRQARVREVRPGWPNRAVPSSTRSHAPPGEL